MVMISKSRVIIAGPTRIEAHHAILASLYEVQRLTVVSQSSKRLLLSIAEALGSRASLSYPRSPKSPPPDAFSRPSSMHDLWASTHPTYGLVNALARRSLQLLSRISLSISEPTGVLYIMRRFMWLKAFLITPAYHIKRQLCTRESALTRKTTLRSASAGRWITSGAP